MDLSEPVPAAIEAQIAFIAIRAYAAHSYLYYVKDVNIISDHDFDYLCRWLEQNYSWLKKHDINDYLNLGALQAGTGHHLRVTGQTREYAEMLLRDHKPKQLTLEDLL